MAFDVVIVGAGPSGLAAAIRLKQMAALKQSDLSVCVIEKGSEVGAHSMSGAVLDPRALDELIPDWKEKGAPLNTLVTRDRFTLLTKRLAIPLPTPPSMHNHGNYIISLGSLCRWLAAEAEALGVEIYPGFAASEILFDDAGSVAGVATGDMGIGRDGQPTANHQAGVELRGRQTLFGEGCRGSLTKILSARFDLSNDADPQTYGLGIKELWEVDPSRHRPGTVLHTVGWPLDQKTYGGSFLYHLENNQVAVGFVVGLDYENPHLSPFEEFQRFKTHPGIRDVFEGGRRVSYGARALNEGGHQAIGRLTFPGGALIGCGAGFLDVSRIKGIHTAMKSGMTAAESVFDVLATDDKTDPVLEAVTYRDRLEDSWVMKDLYAARNLRPGFRFGLLGGLINGALDAYIFRGRAPWTLHHTPDHESLRPIDACKPIIYPKPDGELTFDRLSSVFISNTFHEENQPAHLHLAEPDRAIAINHDTYGSPETLYCPAGVYEIIQSDGEDGPRLQINAQNCIHCKTCDIKDPTQNITWVAPEGGGGPNYPNM